MTVQDFKGRMEANLDKIHDEQTPLPGPSAAPLQPAVAPVPIRVVVTDIDVSFSQMVTLILKFWLASIPAFILLLLCGVFFGSCLGIFAGAAK